MYPVAVVLQYTIQSNTILYNTQKTQNNTYTLKTIHHTKIVYFDVLRIHRAVEPSGSKLTPNLIETLLLSAPPTPQKKKSVECLRPNLIHCSPPLCVRYIALSP
jgi:hypothetical protein